MVQDETVDRGLEASILYVEPCFRHRLDRPYHFLHFQ